MKRPRHSDAATLGHRADCKTVPHTTALYVQPELRSNASLLLAAPVSGRARVEELHHATSDMCVHVGGGGLFQVRGVVHWLMGNVAY